MSNNLPVCRAHWQDIPHIVDLVVGPFADSTIGAWLVPDDHRRRNILSAVVRVWIEHALLFGEAHLLPDHSAAAVWLHRYGPLSPPAGYGERLAVACGEYVDRFLHLDDVLHTHRPDGPHNHLAFFAVAPQPYRVRRASILLATSNARMGHALLPTYTEVATLADRNLYARHGYAALEPFTLPDGSTTYPMWRTPRQRRARHRSSTPPARPDQRGPALNDLPIRLILDTSAILAFTEGSTAVGQAIARVADEGGLFGLPVMCLAEAARSVTDAGRLDLLANHPAATVLTVDPLQWKTLAATHRAVGRLDTAAALLAAAANDCRVLSDQPGR
ncbi:hypothetical protein B0E53_01710 [Micromonospora sp. MH33]|uniref:hypothetical protein n=1 Tax=Micromonospora sp. MH33 TaxID=1945509 RepID=UPI000D29F3CB|nr:hypothetical protein [Micromonospora sp. MH33]PSK66328.1 hypothetical protein B0E53_01710 [Micromonospora sp. MH33]